LSFERAGIIPVDGGRGLRVTLEQRLPGTEIEQEKFGDRVL
jgi:hypothetical protein